MLQSVETTFFAPANINARERFAMPSSPWRRPTAVSQADKTTRSAFMSRCTILLASKMPSSSDDVSTHRRQFDKLRILFLGKSANTEKSAQRGLPWNGINQIQGSCGRRIRYRVGRNQVLPGAVNECIERQEM